jgi:hypothetical protein
MGRARTEKKCPHGADARSKNDNINHATNFIVVVLLPFCQKCFCSFLYLPYVLYIHRPRRRRRGEIRDKFKYVSIPTGIIVMVTTSTVVYKLR